MVRFHWHVEGGLSAFIAGPQSIVSADGEEKIYELPCYIELAGQKETFEGLINVRSGHFGEGRVQPVGVALAHDTDVATARGKVAATLALELAKAGGLPSFSEQMSSACTAQAHDAHTPQHVLDSVRTPRLCKLSVPVPMLLTAALFQAARMQSQHSLPCIAGFVVMRCLFNTAAKDVRRFRLYEKSLDALATSPYARTVDRWLLAGVSRTSAHIFTAPSTSPIS